MSVRIHFCRLMDPHGSVMSGDPLKPVGTFPHEFGSREEALNAKTRPDVQAMANQLGCHTIEVF